MSDIGQLLIHAVKQAAAENPEYTYEPKLLDGHHIPTCMYVENGGPGCIIGKAALEIGLINSAFENLPANTGGIDELDTLLGLGLEGDESAWLEAVQNRQDTGIPWGIAVSVGMGE